VEKQPPRARKKAQPPSKIGGVVMYLAEITPTRGGEGKQGIEHKPLACGRRGGGGARERHVPGRGSNKNQLCDAAARIDGLTGAKVKPGPKIGSLKTKVRAVQS